MALQRSTFDLFPVWTDESHNSDNKPTSPLRKPKKQLTEKVNRTNQHQVRPTTQEDRDRHTRKYRNNIFESSSMHQVMTRPDESAIAKNNNRLTRKKTLTDVFSDLSVNEETATEKKPEPLTGSEPADRPEPQRQERPRQRKSQENNYTFEQARPRSPKKMVTDNQTMNASRQRGNPITWAPTPDHWTSGDVTLNRKVNLRTNECRAAWKKNMSGSSMRGALGGGDW